MATLAAPELSALQRERNFFFYMALAISANVVAGFVDAFVSGRSHFSAPWWIHVHAVSMMCWLGLYVTQTFLVWRGRIAFHRTLGIAVAIWSVWIFAIGLGLTAMDVHAHRSPRFFSPTYFLAMDWLDVIAFAGLVWTALWLRRRPDWHKRLILSGMIVLMVPGVARLFPLALLRERVIWPVLAVQLAYFAVAALYDQRAHGRVHPAYRWGVGVLLVYVVLIGPVAALPPFQALTQALGS